MVYGLWMINFLNPPLLPVQGSTPVRMKILVPPLLLELLLNLRKNRKKKGALIPIRKRFLDHPFLPVPLLRERFRQVLLLLLDLWKRRRKFLDQTPLPAPLLRVLPLQVPLLRERFHRVLRSGWMMGIEDELSNIAVLSQWV